MKQFQFSLGRVLDFKNQMLDREKNELARLRRDRQRAEQTFLNRREEFQRINDELTEKTQRGITVREIAGYQYQLDRLRAELSDIQQEIAGLDGEIDLQLSKVLVMSQDVSGLDKLKEHQKEDFDRQAAKAAETEIAEYVNGKLIRQKEA